jgi:4-alpha-methyl-delta7-sterol-4alpha-methyl oxidase
VPAVPAVLVDAWRDPMFLWFPVAGNLVSMAAFLAFALPLTWLAWREPAWAASWRIQRRRFDVARWAGAAVRAWLRNNAILFALMVAAWPALRGISRVHVGRLPPWWEVAGQVLLFVYLDDLLYWFFHRALHEGVLYRRVHSLHHRIAQPFALTGHDMHPVEFVATALIMLVGPLLVGAHVVTVYAWITLRQLEAAEGHSGFHLPFSPLAWLPGAQAADFHDFHHARFHGNYSGFLGWFDGVMGTYSKGYAEHLAARRGR